MDKLDVRILLSHSQGWIQIAKACGDDEPGSLPDHVLHDALCIGTFRDILDFDQFDIRKIFLHDLRPFGMGLVVTRVCDGADMQDAYLQFWLCGWCSCKAQYD